MRYLLLVCWLAFGNLAHALSIPAPDVALPTFEGDRSVSLQSLRGKVVYINFWASWCSSCEAGFPMLNDLHQTYKDKSFELVSINVDMQKVDAEFFLQKFSAKFTVLYDAERKTPEKFAMQTMPSSYLIDKKGNIRFVFRDVKPGDNKKITDAIQQLLNE